MLGHLQNLFNKPSARELARRELEDARRALLDSQRSVEWFAAEVSYQTKRIARLALASGEASTFSSETVTLGDKSVTKTMHSQNGATVASVPVRDHPKGNLL